MHAMLEFFELTESINNFIETRLRVKTTSTLRR